MKVGELREKARKMTQEELIRVTVELYKRVPKAKKEEYNIDDLINNPVKKTVTPIVRKEANLTELEIEISTFIEHAKSDYYLYQNKVVPKKERPKWRFKVKRWYKALTNPKRVDSNLEQQAALLSQLYQLMAESYHTRYFTSDDVWMSIGIEKEVFLKTILDLLQASNCSDKQFIENGLQLIFRHGSSYDTYIMDIFIPYIDDSKVFKLAHQRTQQYLVNNITMLSKNEKRSDYQIYDRNNMFVKFILKLFIQEEEYQLGIQFYQEHYKEQYPSPEIKLYVLVSILIRYGLGDEIIQVIEAAITDGIEPRKKLLEVMKTIKSTRETPRYL